MTFPIRLIIYSVMEGPRSIPCKILTYLFPKHKIGVMVSIILYEYMDNTGWVIGNSCKYGRERYWILHFNELLHINISNLLFIRFMSWWFPYFCIVQMPGYRMWNIALWNGFLFQDEIYVLTSTFNGALFIQHTKIVTLEWNSFPLFANKLSDVSRK